MNGADNDKNQGLAGESIVRNTLQDFQPPRNRGDRQGKGNRGNMQNTNNPDPQRELSRLRQEHRDLDSAIEALERIEAGDRLQIQRLKKRKLVLKDQISFIEDQITPDIIA
jgi:hypothetical protein